MDSLASKTLNSMFLPRKNTQKSAEKVENVNFDTLRRPFWIPPFLEGAPWFSNFFNFFFENGIKRYQVTNLSRVHDDLKLCPKNNSL